MNELDLDQIQQRWQSTHRTIEPTLAIDVDALRASLAKRSRRAFSRHAFWLGGQMLLQLAVLVALGAFLIEYWHDTLYRVFAMALAMLVLAQVVVSARRWRVLRWLDYTAPTSLVGEQVARLRSEQLRVTRWILLSSVLLWLPVLLVILKGLTGFDLLTVLHPSVLAINLLVGVAVLLLGDLVMRWVARRFAGSRWLHALLAESAGHSWQRAEQAFDARTELEQMLADDETGVVVDRYRQREELPQRVRVPLRALRSRLLLVGVFYAFGLLLVGVFNASHGGQLAFLIPGVLLNFFFVAQMASAIQHRAQLSRLDAAWSADALDSRIERAAREHVSIVRVSLWFTPIFALLVVQILAKAVLGIDAFAVAPSTLRVALLVSAAIGCVVVARHSARPIFTSIFSGLMFGVPRLSAALRSAINSL